MLLLVKIEKINIKQIILLVVTLIVEKHLHIISLDVPYPLDYGGVYDIFYKIKTLSEAGIIIHLHCFEYGRGTQPELNKYCKEVHYYSRRTWLTGLFSGLPYIVSSRKNDRLFTNLLKDQHPILLEGIHCSFIVHDNRFNGRRLILRLHNVEYLYYQQLYKSSLSAVKKLYYLYESKLLKRYEKSIASAVTMLTFTEKDKIIYKREFMADNIHYLPVFLPYEKVQSTEGTGCFCLYHGNLSIAENEKAALFLIKEVFNDLEIPLVIAGKNPSERIIRAAQKNLQTCIVSNPSEQEMQDMIFKAQIHVIPSFNNTGIKLKLLNALFNGRHCIVNESTVDGTALEQACHIAGNAASFKQIVMQLYHSPFTNDETRQRSEILAETFNNRKNANQLIAWIW